MKRYCAGASYSGELNKLIVFPRITFFLLEWMILYCGLGIEQIKLILQIKIIPLCNAAPSRDLAPVINQQVVPFA
jgi:hypothetical protein